MSDLRSRLAHGWTPAVLASAAGIAAVAVALAGPAALSPSGAFRAASAAGSSAMLAAAAAVFLSDAWVRADRRALAFGASCAATGAAWLAAVPAGAGQGGQALSLLARAVCAASLLASAALPAQPKLHWPRITTPLALAGSAAGGAALAGIVYLASPRLPSLLPAGRLTAADHVASGVIAAVLVAAVLLYLWRGGSGVSRGWVLAALVLLGFEAVGWPFVDHQYSAGWYSLSALRLAAFAVLAAGGLARYPASARQERRKAAEVDALASAAASLGACASPAEIAAAVAAGVRRLARDAVSATVRVGLYHVDGASVTAVAEAPGGADRAGSSFGLGSDTLIREAVESAGIAAGSGADARVVSAVTCRGEVVGAIEVAPEGAAPGWADRATLDLLGALSAIAGLALANADALSELETAERQSHAVLAAVGEAYVSLTGDGLVVGWNGRATDLFGWQPHEVVGRPLVDLVLSEEARRRYRERLGRYIERGGAAHDTFAMEVDAVHRCGEPLDVEVQGWRVGVGPGARICLLVTDRSARRSGESPLSRRATHDPLTELPNRSMIAEFLTRALHTGNHGDERVAVLSVDLDDFRAINERWGHEAGDRLLTTVAYRLVAVARPGDAVGRLGGNRFVVVCRGVRSPSELQMVAARLQRTLSDPVQLVEGDVAVTASVGFAVSGADSTARDLLRQAEGSMRAAKTAGRRDPRPLGVLSQGGL